MGFYFSCWIKFIVGADLAFWGKIFWKWKNPICLFYLFLEKRGRACSQHPPIAFWDLATPGDWEARPREITRKAGILESGKQQNYSKKINSREVNTL